MPRMNYVRLILAGLAGGVVANVCDALINVVMAGDMHIMMRRLGLNPDLMNSQQVALTWIAIDFLYATLIAWTYAAIRPRFGAGAATAVTAGLVPYLAATMILFGFVGMGLFTPDLFWKNAVLSLGTVVLTSLVVGLVYKEAGDARQPSPRA